MIKDIIRENRYSLEFILSKWNDVVAKTRRKDKGLSLLLQNNIPHNFLHEDYGCLEDLYSELYFEVNDYHTYEIISKNYDIIKSNINSICEIEVVIIIRVKNMDAITPILMFYSINNADDAKELYKKIAERKILLHSRDLRLILDKYPYNYVNSHFITHYGLLYFCREDAKDIIQLFDDAISNFRNDQDYYRFYELYQILSQEYKRVLAISNKNTRLRELNNIGLVVYMDKFKDAFDAGCWQCAYYIPQLHLMTLKEDEDGGQFRVGLIEYWMIKYLELIYENGSFNISSEIHDYVINCYRNGIGVVKDIKRAYYWALLRAVYISDDDKYKDDTVVSDIEKELPLLIQFEIQEKANKTLKQYWDTKNKEPFYFDDWPRGEIIPNKIYDIVDKTGKFDLSSISGIFEKDYISIKIHVEGHPNNLNKAQIDYFYIQYKCNGKLMQSRKLSLKDGHYKNIIKKESGAINAILVKIGYYYNDVDMISKTIEVADTNQTRLINSLFKYIFSDSSNNYCINKKNGTCSFKNIELINPHDIQK